MAIPRVVGAGAALTLMLLAYQVPGGDGPVRSYRNQLTPLVNPKPIVADYPEFIEPIRETARFEAPPLIEDRGGNIRVRAWRFSYNARGIIEMPKLASGSAFR